jgi:hypothetical protein
MNPNGHKVEVIHADAFEYLPPEPVDVVICEMIHVAMLREKQVEVIESFKRRYLARFGGPLPVFLPEAVDHGGPAAAAGIRFRRLPRPDRAVPADQCGLSGHVELAQPAVYSIIDFSQPVDSLIAWEGRFLVEKGGRLNALRFITKNVLSIVEEEGTTIDWLNHYMMLPLASRSTCAPATSCRCPSPTAPAARSRRWKPRCVRNWWRASMRPPQRQRRPPSYHAYRPRQNLARRPRGDRTSPLRRQVAALFSHRSSHHFPPFIASALPPARAPSYSEDIEQKPR